MEQMHGMQQNGAARPGYGEGLDEQLAEWSAELFRDPQYRNTWADAEHSWRLESAARTRLIIKKQLREEIEQEMAKELGLPANWRGNKLKSLAEWHEKMACLAKADAAPRCEHVFQDGTRCGSPRMKAGELCYAHERMAKVRPRKLNLLAMEDANSIMLNIMEINRALVDEEITEKRAGMLLYSQQLGLQALGKLTFQKTRPEELVRLEEIAADERRKAQIGGENLTAEGAEDAEEEEKFAADQRREAQIGEENLTTEDTEGTEGGRDELSPVDDGMEGIGEGHRVIGGSDDRVIGKAEELTLTPAHEACAGDPGAKDAKIAKQEEVSREQTRTSTNEEKVTAEVAENAEEEEFAIDEHRRAQIGEHRIRHYGPTPGPSHEIKDLADPSQSDHSSEVGMAQQSGASSSAMAQGV
jgi:hypothetical protein